MKKRLKKLLAEASEMLDVFDISDLGRHSDPPIEPGRVRDRIDDYRRKRGWLPDQAEQLAASPAVPQTSAYTFTARLAP